MLVLAVLAWALVIPSNVGGLTTYALVSGQSMEPTLQDGTLVVARTRSHYAVGDVVVYTALGGSVMHRIVSGSEDAGFVTQGDNNGFVDPWRVWPSDIHGEAVGIVPALGTLLREAARHPLHAAAVAALLMLLLSVPWRRRRVVATYAEALARTSAEERAPVPAGTRLLVGIAYGATFLSLGASVAALALHSPPWPTLALSLGGLVASIGGLSFVSAVAYDGLGQPADMRARAVLSGRTRVLVGPIPEDGSVTPLRVPRQVDSPTRLRDLAVAHRLPVIHRVDPSGREDWVLATAQADFRLTPPPSSRCQNDSETRAF